MQNHAAWLRFGFPIGAKLSLTRKDLEGGSSLLGSGYGAD
jgi:hypothetical protein